MSGAARSRQESFSKNCRILHCGAKETLKGTSSFWRACVNGFAVFALNYGTLCSPARYRDHKQQTAECRVPESHQVVKNYSGSLSAVLRLCLWQAMALRNA